MRKKFSPASLVSCLKVETNPTVSPGMTLDKNTNDLLLKEYCCLTAHYANHCPGLKDLIYRWL